MSGFDFTENQDSSLITNFFVSELSHYEKAIEMFGDDTLYIDSGAFDCNGRRLPDSLALRTKDFDKDRTDFWDVFDSLEEKYQNS